MKLPMFCFVAMFTVNLRWICMSFCEISCAISTKLSARKRIWSLENEVEFLKIKEITCIFFEIDTGMSTSNQFRYEIEKSIH